MILVMAFARKQLNNCQLNLTVLPMHCIKRHVLAIAIEFLFAQKSIKHTNPRHSLFVRVVTGDVCIMKFSHCTDCTGRKVLAVPTPEFHIPILVKELQVEVALKSVEGVPEVVPVCRVGAFMKVNVPVEFLFAFFIHITYTFLPSPFANKPLLPKAIIAVRLFSKPSI